VGAASGCVAHRCPVARRTTFLAQLQGASLEEAQLQGANLYFARLDGASLNRAQLQGALLYTAWLLGASHFNAQLQGSQLIGSGLWGASSEGAQLQGALLESNFAAADMRKAFVWRATFGKRALEGRVLASDLTWGSVSLDVEQDSGPWTQEKYQALRQSRGNGSASWRRTNTCAQSN
jgi:uncharacterized protein YjbI with pentapeptide repeats